MEDFKNIGKVHGVPVYYKQANNTVKSSAIRLVVLTGSTDDTLVDGGKPGLYHWFEHIPFRGTSKYTGGKKNVRTLIAKTGGNINASTSSFNTTFSAHVPTRYIELAVDVLVDLVSCPLLRKKDIEAERTIIKEEILESLNSPQRQMNNRVVSEIFRGHPLSQENLGTAKDLDTIDTATLRKAHELGYSTSRMYFVIETSVKKDAVVKMLSKIFERLPFNSSASARSKLVSIKPIIWKPSVNVVIPSKMKSSKVFLCFPTTGARVFEDGISRWVMNSLLTHSSTQSPLMMEARHKQLLTYDVDMDNFYSPDGGFFTFEAETSEPERILEIFKTKILFDKRLYTRVWFDTVKKAMLNYRDMRSPNPRSNVSSAANTVARFGEYYTDDYTQEVLERVSFKDVQRNLEEQRSNLEISRSFIFKAKKK